MYVRVHACSKQCRACNHPLPPPARAATNHPFRQHHTTRGSLSLSASYLLPLTSYLDTVNPQLSSLQPSGPCPFPCPYHPLRALLPQPSPPTVSTPFLSPNHPSTGHPFVDIVVTVSANRFSGPTRSSPPPIHIAFVSLVIVILVPSGRIPFLVASLSPNLPLSSLVPLLASRPISIPPFPSPRPSAYGRLTPARDFAGERREYRAGLKENAIIRRTSTNELIVGASRYTVTPRVLYSTSPRATRL